MSAARTTEATATVVLIVLALMLDACSGKQPQKPNVINEFQRAISRDRELVFIDSSQLGASTDGAILSLHFFADSQVRLYTWGNGFSNYPGTYTFTENNGLKLSFNDQRWPRLTISSAGNVFTLERKDGLKSLEKSYVHTGPNGIRRQVDDEDIYPAARRLIFPLTQRIATAKQDAAK